MVAILQIDLQTKEFVPTKTLLCFREHVTPAVSIIHDEFVNASLYSPKPFNTTGLAATERGRPKVSNVIRFFKIQRHIELLNSTNPQMYDISNCNFRLYIIYCRAFWGVDTYRIFLIGFQQQQNVCIMFRIAYFLNFLILNVLDDSYHSNLYYKCQK